MGGNQNFDLIHVDDSKKIDAVLESCKDFIQLKQDESKPKALAKQFIVLVKRCIQRYPLVKHFDRDIFRPYRNSDKNFCKEVINYMNVIDATWKEPENIFKVADKKNLTSK